MTNRALISLAKIRWGRAGDMAKHTEPYRIIIMQSYEISSTSGKRGKVHFRTIEHPLQDPSAVIGLDVECTRSLRQYPVGTIFQIQSKLTDREGDGDYYYSHHSWGAKIIENPNFKSI